ncbi:MAG: ectonucleotide pyrophosphatase/phosphodiesterase, partial [Clostridia bacterium]|nr:ectonucleotide pyrophosphatase/phosphodiesterase [Clostridia bacterium]
MSNRKVIVFSCDAMVYEDIKYLINKSPRFAELVSGGSMVKRTRTIYPSVTYPCHTTMSTGCYPDKHGVINNSVWRPEQLKNVPWRWFADAIHCPDIFTAAKKAGLSTACVFWPVTGNHKYIDYNLPEYWPQTPEETNKEAFLRAGTTEKVWTECVEPFIGDVKIRSHPGTDDFLMNVSCEMIRRYKPDLLMIHTGDLDSFRHRYGIFNDWTKRGSDDAERWLFDLIDATKEAGVFENTDFFLVSDHGQMDIVRNIKPNVVFADHGLITVAEDGSLADWQAYCYSTGLSAQIMLKNPDAKELWNKTYELLNDGRHRYVCASRRKKDDLMAVKTDAESRTALPDAVSCFVVVGA